MSKQAVADFLIRVADDGNLQQALAEFAARRGFRFAAGDLREVIRSVAGGIEDAGTTSAESPEDRDNDVVDPGFGIIEYPA